MFEQYNYIMFILLFYLYRAKHPYVQAVTELGEGVVYRML